MPYEGKLRSREIYLGEMYQWQRHRRPALQHRIRSLGADDLEYAVVQAKVTAPPRGIAKE
jgi:hypothetical protein